MSGYKKRRARNQRYRSMRRAWNAGYRPKYWSDTVISEKQYSKVAITGGPGVVHLQGLDADGNLVEETLEFPRLEIQSFDEWLIECGMKRRPTITKLVLPPYQ